MPSDEDIVKLVLNGIDLKNVELRQKIKEDFSKEISGVLGVLVGTESRLKMQISNLDEKATNIDIKLSNLNEKVISIDTRLSRIENRFDDIEPKISSSILVKNSMSEIDKRLTILERWYSDEIRRRNEPFSTYRD